MQVEGSLVMAKPTLWQRLVRRVFPQTYPNTLEVEDHLKVQVAGWMATDTFAHFDWKDRLRLLVSGKVAIRARHLSDKPLLGNVTTVATVSVLPPWATKEDL